MAKTQKIQISSKERNELYFLQKVIFIPYRRLDELRELKLLLDEVDDLLEERDVEVALRLGEDLLGVVDRLPLIVVLFLELDVLDGVLVRLFVVALFLTLDVREDVLVRLFAVPEVRLDEDEEVVRELDLSVLREGVTVFLSLDEVRLLVEVRFDEFLFPVVALEIVNSRVFSTVLFLVLKLLVG